jgi:hypothetical protein
MFGCFHARADTRALVVRKGQIGTDPMAHKQRSALHDRVGVTSLALNRWSLDCGGQALSSGALHSQKGWEFRSGNQPSAADRVSETLRHRTKARAVVVAALETTSRFDGELQSLSI